jgi:hypothetical protein
MSRDQVGDDGLAVGVLSHQGKSPAEVVQHEVNLGIII